jgi:cell wall-associated NlpC family hydrolase
MTRRTLNRVVTVAVLLLLPALAQAQGSERAEPAGNGQAAKPSPKPFESISKSTLALRDSIVTLARAQIGKRYVLGGKSPSKGFDCSGLVQYIVSALDIALPRTAREQAHAGVAVPRDTAELLPGDLLTFGKGKQITHIGIYVGEGRMVHASTKAGRVIETKLLRPPAPGIKPWQGARRLALDSVMVDGGEY